MSQAGETGGQRGPTGLDAESRRLKAEWERLARLTSNLPAMVYQAISFPDGRSEFTYVSPRMRRTYEVEDDDQRSVTETLFARVHPDDREKVQSENEEAITRLEPWSGEHRIVTPSGRTLWVEGSSNPIPMADGSVEWDGLIVDVTERRKAELELKKAHEELESRVEERTAELVMAIDRLEREIAVREKAERELKDHHDHLEKKVRERTAQLERAKERAESADRLKSAFLATMSHELRTPMNSIIGFTSILHQGLAGPINEEQKKQLAMVRTSATHLLDLINDVLDISKIEAGQFRLSVDEFNLIEVIESVLQTHQKAAKDKALRLSCDIATESAMMFSDRRRVEQILINLIDNAIKFTDQGEVRIRLETAGPNAVRVTVSDTGIGIDDGDLPRLFKAFQQLDSGIRRQRDGSGLGLAISRRLAELLGGDISVSSVFGEGSHFSLLIPLRAPTRGDQP